MTEIPLSTWAAMAEIIGAGSIVTGLIVGLFQIRQFRIQQRDAVAINLAQTFYSHDLSRAISLMQGVPDGTSLEELREEQQQPSWGEWFEWLGDQARLVKHEQEPAHVRYRGAGPR